MNDSEIIKALECCVQNTREACVECPIGFEGRDLCLNVAMEEAIGLINRQKAEIDRYKINLPHLEQQDEDFCGVLCDFAEELIGKAKSEARKEFAKRLKAIAIEKCSVPIVFNDIDNLLKEMTEQTTFEKVEHNSLCETETYKGGE